VSVRGLLARRFAENESSRHLPLSIFGRRSKPARQGRGCRKVREEPR